MKSLGRLASPLLALLLIVAPTLATGVYLYQNAADQYMSRASFAVRSLDSAPSVELLGMVAPTSGVGGEDALVLFDYILSQPMVEALDARLDLEEIYTPPEADWLFRLGRDRTIEQKLDYWRLAVSVSFDNASRVLEITVLAFTPEDANRIAHAIVQESQVLINEISEQARADAVRFAEFDLAQAEERLRAARLGLERFRAATQEIDPVASAQLAAELVGALETELAQSRARLREFRDQLDADAPPIRRLQARIESLERQIEEEMAKIAGEERQEGASGATLSADLARFEELKVETEFATQLYTTALGALAQAQGEARRSQRYLATHVSPTIPQEARHPRRLLLTLAVFVSGVVLWGVTMMVVSNIRDRA